jgi:methylmalonyl-CoA mutase N-terminal domain/subunit
MKAASAGSYFLESLTDEIEKKAVEYIERIDKMGGVAVAIEKGYLQQEIADSAYRYQKDIEGKGRIVVGVNEFKTGEEGTMDTLKVDPEVESKQKQGLAKLREERDGGKVAQSLRDLGEEANKETNLVPYVLDCVSSLATLGEISDVLRKSFGRYEGGRIV